MMGWVIGAEAQCQSSAGPDRLLPLGRLFEREAGSEGVAESASSKWSAAGREIQNNSDRR
jgi:hypothetical protein